MDPFHRAAAVFEAPDVALQEREPLPLILGDGVFDLVEIPFVACGEVVQAGDAPAGFEQGFEEIRANKAGDTRHQPHLSIIVEHGLFVEHNNFLIPTLLTRPSQSQFKIAGPPDTG
jgi:hypothetical protein